MKIVALFPFQESDSPSLPAMSELIIGSSDLPISCLLRKADDCTICGLSRARSFQSSCG